MFLRLVRGTCLESLFSALVGSTSVKFVYIQIIRMSSIIYASFLSAILLAAPFLAPILFPAAWIAFVPLFWAIIHAKNLRIATFSGWLTGVIAHLVGFHWLIYTI